MPSRVNWMRCAPKRCPPWGRMTHATSAAYTLLCATADCLVACCWCWARWPRDCGGRACSGQAGSPALLCWHSRKSSKTWSSRITSSTANTTGCVTRVSRVSATSGTSLAPLRTGASPTTFATIPTPTSVAWMKISVMACCAFFPSSAGSHFICCSHWSLWCLRFCSSGESLRRTCTWDAGSKAA
ncbi:MAG: hypothetical protein BWZ07_00743 [Alphaproteobacteria bacterium ADurb.BinA280]|nr:MAG: hypothetical protein BWZ07_00743 [Alphaproteobacteria bacterium ADurb.BinA280]